MRQCFGLATLLSILQVIKGPKWKWAKVGGATLLMPQLAKANQVAPSRERFAALGSMDKLWEGLQLQDLGPAPGRYRAHNQLAMASNLSIEHIPDFLVSLALSSRLDAVGKSFTSLSIRVCAIDSATANDPPLAFHAEMDWQSEAVKPGLFPVCPKTCHACQALSPK